MKLRCLFGHVWGGPENIRRAPASLDDLLFPFPCRQESLGANRICDRTCHRCGATKTFECDPRTMALEDYRVDESRESVCPVAPVERAQPVVAVEQKVH